MNEQGAIVYIWGNLTSDNFTPRSGRDTVGKPGRGAGLSASETIPAGRKAQGIDLGKLKAPMRAFRDDPLQGGTAGHVAIAPVDENGMVDMKRLEEWAATRNSGVTHEFTQILLDAVVEPNIKGDV